MRCPTVRVKSEHSPDGYIVINESDLTDKHEVVSEVSAELAPALVETDPDPYRFSVPIPDNWESMHWKRQAKLAKALGREGDASGDEAKAFIALKVAERAGQ